MDASVIPAAPQSRYPLETFGCTIVVWLRLVVPLYNDAALAGHLKGIIRQLLVGVLGDSKDLRSARRRVRYCQIAVAIGRYARKCWLINADFSEVTFQYHNVTFDRCTGDQNKTQSYS